MSSPNDNQNSWFGLALLVMFLACDGLTSTMQEKLFKEHKTSKYNQMLYISGSSAVVSLISVVSMGKLSYCLAFGSEHSDFIANAALLSTAAAASQWFIYSQIQEFGALVFAATMNVRQVASILVSYATYSHSITLLQVLGLMVIFMALFYKSFASLKESSWQGQKAKKEVDETPCEKV